MTLLVHAACAHTSIQNHSPWNVFAADAQSLERLRDTRSRFIGKLIERTRNDTDREGGDPKRPQACQLRPLWIEVGVVDLRSASLLFHLLILPVQSIIQSRICIAGGLGSVALVGEHVFHNTLLILIGVERACEERAGAVTERRADGIVRVLAVIEWVLRVAVRGLVECREGHLGGRCSFGNAKVECEDGGPGRCAGKCHEDGDNER